MTVQVIKRSVPMKKLFLVFLFICLGLKLGVKFTYGFTFDWNRFNVGIGSEFVRSCFMHLEVGEYELAIKEGMKAINMINVNPIVNYFAHFCVGESFLLAGNLDTALLYFEQTKHLAFNEMSLIRAYKNLGRAYRSKGDFDSALFYFNQALDLSRAYGLRDFEGVLLYQIGLVYLEKKDLDRALDYFEQSLKFEKNDKNKAITYNSIGFAYLDKKDYKKAEEAYKKALEIAKRIGAHSEVVGAVISLGHLYMLTGNDAKAEELFFEGLRQALKIGDKFLIGLAYQKLGMLYLKKQNLNLAIEYFTKAYDLYHKIGATSKAKSLAEVLFILKQKMLKGNVK